MPRRTEVRHGFDNAEIYGKGVFYKLFSVACYGRAAYLYSVREKSIKFTELFPYNFDGFSLVGVVEGVKNVTVLVYKYKFCRCASAVNAEICSSAVCVNVSHFDRCLFVSVGKLYIFVFCFKKRRKCLDISRGILSLFNARAKFVISKTCVLL